MTQSELIAELVKALETSMTAIDDWLNVYASEFCDKARVAEAQKRINGEHGTLAYIAIVQEQNRKALSHAHAVQSDEWHRPLAEAIRHQIDSIKINVQRCGWREGTDEWNIALGKLQGLVMTLAFVDPSSNKIDLSLPSPPSKQEGE